tara:strand:+ start:119 stop:436 length:318 start_codon:yes stop_codon:yes gene_type:complete
MNEVQDAIEEKYGKGNYKKIAKEFSEEKYLNISPGDIEDLISDLIDNDYKVDDTIYGSGDFGEYSIEIQSFGPLFWVQGQEFDPIQFFKSFDEALSCAVLNYLIL